MDKGCIEKMVTFGISEHEVRIYLALLERREHTALELHELTNVPRTKIYEITKNMIQRGICIEKQIGRKKKYQAVAPEIVLTNLVRDQEAELNGKKKLAQDILKVINPIYDRGSQIGDVTEYVEIVKGLSSIHERFVSLVRNTQREHLSFVKAPYVHQLKNQKVAEQENAEFEILKRGAVAKALYEFPSKEYLEPTITHIEKCIAAGEKARVIEQVPVKMHILDARYVLLALENPRSEVSALTTLVIEHPGLARTARMAFEYLWEKAKDPRILRDLLKTGGSMKKHSAL